MYLSNLLINVGDDPDRPRPGRKWLRNLYRVHQRLCMAFPSAQRRSDDPQFLERFIPEHFGEDQVHVQREAGSGFLFRVDPQSMSRVVILVQSAVEPDWDYAFHNACHLLAAKPEWKECDRSFDAGEKLSFRLTANPTRRLSRRSLGADGNPVRDGAWCNGNQKGKRVPVPEDLLFDWLAHRSEPAGFSVEDSAVTIQPGYVYFDKGPEKQARLFSSRYEGVLTVADPARFRIALSEGFGSAKAFGFGLMSVARP